MKDRNVVFWFFVITLVSLCGSVLYRYYLANEAGISVNVMVDRDTGKIVRSSPISKFVWCTIEKILIVGTDGYTKMNVTYYPGGCEHMIGGAPMGYEVVEGYFIRNRGEIRIIYDNFTEFDTSYDIARRLLVLRELTGGY